MEQWSRGWISLLYHGIAKDTNSKVIPSEIYSITHHGSFTCFLHEIVIARGSSCVCSFSWGLENLYHAHVAFPACRWQEASNRKASERPMSGWNLAISNFKREWRTFQGFVRFCQASGFHVFVQNLNFVRMGVSSKVYGQLYRMVTWIRMAHFVWIGISCGFDRSYAP